MSEQLQSLHKKFDEVKSDLEEKIKSSEMEMKQIFDFHQRKPSQASVALGSNKVAISGSYMSSEREDQSQLYREMESLTINGSEAGYDNLEYLERGRSNLDDTTIQSMSQAKSQINSRGNAWNMKSHLDLKGIDSEQDQLEFGDINLDDERQNSAQNRNFKSSRYQQ